MFVTVSYKRVAPIQLAMWGVVTVTLLLPCVAAQSDDEEEDSPFLSTKDLSTVKGILLICCIIVFILIIVMSIILTYCCWIKCCGHDIKDKKQQRRPFRDTEEGNVELINLKEVSSKEETEGGGEDGEKPPTDANGEAKEEPVQPKTEEVTLSTFGHTSNDKKESGDTMLEKEDNNEKEVPAEKEEKGEGASKEVDQTPGQENGKEAQETVDVHAKEGKSLTTEGGPENSKNKQETDSKTVEAVEQTQGQIMAVEGSTMHPIPVAPPIIFDLSVTSKKSTQEQPVSSSKTSSKDGNKEESMKEGSNNVTEEPASSSKTASKDPDKEESMKESSSSDTKAVSEVTAKKKGEKQSEVKDENKTEETPKSAEPENKPSIAGVMDFDDIEQVLGLALKDLGDM